MTAPQRIQLRRTAGWRLPPGAVSVARPTIYGNPYRVGEDVEVVADDGMSATLPATPDLAVALYRSRLECWLDPFERAVELPSGAEVIHDEDVAGEEYIAALLAELRGRDLACWCSLDEVCHADVLLELANR
jgi:hypothetical protein